MKRGILLINLGTPAAPTATAVRPFLRRFLSDRRVITLPRALWKPILELMILPHRPKKSAAMYQQIWTEAGSPLATYTTQQVASLQERFPAALVRAAFSYSQPLIADQLAALEEAGVDALTIIPLYPQYSTTTVGSVLDEVTAFYHQRQRVPSLQVVTSFYHHPTYLDLLAAKIKAAWQAGDYQQLIVSYHGLPASYVAKGDPYAAQCQQTTAALEERLGGIPLTASFQSKFGPGQWLTPATSEVLASLPSQGIKRVLVVSPAFTTDCLETNYELGIENKQSFLAAGGEEYGLVPCLNADEGFIDFLGQLVDHPTGKSL